MLTVRRRMVGTHALQCLRFKRDKKEQERKENERDAPKFHNFQRSGNSQHANR